MDSASAPFACNDYISEEFLIKRTYRWLRFGRQKETRTASLSSTRDPFFFILPRLSDFVLSGAVSFYRSFSSFLLNVSDCLSSFVCFCPFLSFSRLLLSRCLKVSVYFNISIFFQRPFSLRVSL